MQVQSVVQTGRRTLGHVVPFVIFGGCLVVLWPVIAAQDLSQLGRLWQTISAADWALAAAFTALSFWAVGKYDVLAHRHFDLQTDASRAHRSGMAAIAVSQTLGAGIVTGSLARWRALPEVSAVTSAKITTFVTVLFLAAMALIVGLAVLIAPGPAALRWPAGLAVLVALAASVLALLVPRLRVGRWHMDMPGLRAIAAALGWVTLDLVAACTAIYVLIPSGAEPPVMAFFVAFCVALAAGITSGTPGGVGPFELVLLSLTAAATPAATAHAPLIVAICGFRLVYYALPAILAVAYLLRPVSRAPHRKSGLARADLNTAPRAELGVLRQSQGALRSLGGVSVGLWNSAQVRFAMFDPFERPGPAFFADLAQQATARNRFAGIYKCRAKTATMARRAGWHVVHMADDAVVDVRAFDTQGPQFARLRRKLRRAQKDGVCIRTARVSDMVQMRALDVAWQDRTGPARGATMGRFCEDYLQGQQVFVAEVRGTVVAFASFHTCAREWTLDLMRDGPDSPDGTMYALIVHAIETSCAQGALDLCLAAAPACPNPASAAWRFFAMKTAAMSHSAGLRQFKSAFGPRWTPLYMASPSRFGMTVCALDVAREILFPGPVQAPTSEIPAAFANHTHDKDEYYEVVSRSAA